MRVLRGSHKGYKLGEEVQGNYAMQGLIKYDKADVSSPLLEFKCLIIVATLALRQLLQTYHAARLWIISILFLYVCV